jgi:hypothetical protein
MALQDTAAAEAAGGEHLLHWMAVDMFQHAIAAELLTHLPQL